MRRLFLYGADEPAGVRLALNVNEAERRWDQILIVDEGRGDGGSVLGVPIVGGMEALGQVERSSADVQCLLSGSPLERWRLRARLERYGLPFATLVHPSVDRTGARLEGDVVAHEHATLAPETIIASGSLVQTAAVVGHEARVGPGCVLGAGSVLNARVVLAQGVATGINSVVIPEQEIGAWATIGPGSVVMEPVPAGASVLGVPGRVVGVDPLPDPDPLRDAVEAPASATAPGLASPAAFAEASP